MDKISKAHRSWNMSRIRSKGTAPEEAVYRELKRKGLRIQKHRTDLPGSPDLVLPEKKIAIFVHGCFWHRHTGCRFAYTPKTRRSFWLGKFRRNRQRDREAAAELRQMGWTVRVVWECETARFSFKKADRAIRQK